MMLASLRSPAHASRREEKDLSAKGWEQGMLTGKQRRSVCAEGRVLARTLLPLA